MIGARRDGSGLERALTGLAVGALGFVLLSSCADEAKPRSPVPTLRPAPQSVPEPPHRPTVEDRCAGPTALVGDLDGDKVPDRAFQGWYDPSGGRSEGPHIGVCTSTGVVEDIDGAIEDFWLADPDGDGVYLVVFGGNSVSAGSDSLAQVRDGHLRVLDIDLPYGLTGSGQPFTSASRWGCTDLDGDGAGSITSATVTANPGGLLYQGDHLKPVLDAASLTWERKAFSLTADGTVAVVRTDRGQLTPQNSRFGAGTEALLDTLIYECRAVR